jgi:hypothetical protein
MIWSTGTPLTKSGEGTVGAGVAVGWGVAVGSGVKVGSNVAVGVALGAGVAVGSGVVVGWLISGDDSWATSAAGRVSADEHATSDDKAMMVIMATNGTLNKASHCGFDFCLISGSRLVGQLVKAS